MSYVDETTRVEIRGVLTGGGWSGRDACGGGGGVQKFLFAIVHILSGMSFSGCNHTGLLFPESTRIK